MPVTHLPPPWIIAEVERRRREDAARDERPSLELPLPPPFPRDVPSPRDPSKPVGGTVIVIDLW